ncbi:Putative phosphatase YieH [hydrothermal vent metagenome]|uniref:Phosphatase YieH n=1 Tax=hydrothermal vent metagenome TaxID=652676 RepID=A0A3B0RW19_9ZZZZ
MTIDLVIFDCDGVLVDSEPLANEELRKALAEQGLDLSLDEVVETFVGLSMNKVVNIAGDKLGHDLPDDFLDRLQVKTFAAFELSLKPVEGIRDILAQLQDMPQKICVASSGSFEKMDITLGLTGLKGFFQDNIFSVSQVKRGKPYPDLYLYAAEQMDSDPARCLVIEDSLPGVQGAVAAGMDVLAYSVRGQSQRLAIAGGMVISSMDEVIEYLS